MTDMAVNDLERARGDAARAAAVIRMNGWCQELYETPDGRVCVEGALFRSYGGFLTSAGQLRDYRRVVREALGDPDASLFRWNDDPARTVDDVLEALDRAAAGG